MKRISLPSWACPRRIILASSGLLLLVTGQVVVFRTLTPLPQNDGAQSVAMIEPSSAPDDVFEEENTKPAFGLMDLKHAKSESQMSYAPQAGLALTNLSLPHSEPLTTQPKIVKESQIGIEDKPLLKPLQGKHARIAIVIDDMGVNKKMSAEALSVLPAEITLSFLPYAPDVQQGMDQALSKGHEVILHIPMQPLSASENAGPNALTVSMSDDDIHETLTKMIGGLSGYTGMNNHMGSRFTGDLSAMNAFMDIVGQKKTYFLDSRTIGASKGAEAAAANHVAFAARDVFLDHVEGRASVEKQLRELEKTALKQGSAIAIGHPKVNTLAALQEWLPDAQSRGFEIVPVKSLVHELPDPEQTTALVTYERDVKAQ